MLLVGVGGALGTTTRAVLESSFPSAGGWPWTTMVINVAGSFALAVLLDTLAALGRDQGWLRRMRLAVGTGVLGGFTTYSTFMVETLQLGDAHGPLWGLAHALTSVALGCGAALAGMVAVAALRRRLGRT